MALPDWLLKATGAMAFADPLKNGGKPTFGDALQGVGHSMMQHYRGEAGTTPAAPTAAPAPAPTPGGIPIQAALSALQHGLQPSLGGAGGGAPQAPPIAPAPQPGAMVIPQAPQVAAFTPNFAPRQIDMASILASLGR